MTAPDEPSAEDLAVAALIARGSDTFGALESTIGPVGCREPATCDLPRRWLRRTGTVVACLTCGALHVASWGGHYDGVAPTSWRTWERL